MHVLFVMTHVSVLQINPKMCIENNAVVVSILVTKHKYASMYSFLSAAMYTLLIFA